MHLGNSAINCIGTGVNFFNLGLDPINPGVQFVIMSIQASVQLIKVRTQCTVEFFEPGIPIGVEFVDFIAHPGCGLRFQSLQQLLIKLPNDI